MSNPLVTILSPCYNVEEYLPQCIDSIICQTYHNLQVVLIDDGSQDNTWKVMQEYAAKDSRLEIYHQENQGVATTRNKLLEKAKGDYVLFIDSDDWIESNMVDFLVNKAFKHNADVTICGMVIDDAPVRTECTETVLTQEECIKAFLFHNELRGSLCNKFIKTNLLHNVKFHCGISYGEDALFCWHLLQKARTVVMTNRQLYHYRMNNSSISHQVFGRKKLTGHLAWTFITEETAQWWPQYLYIAQARHCIEDTLLLRDAAHCHYQNMNDVKMLQKKIRELRHTLNDVEITSKKMRLYALVASYSYWLASKI